MIPAANTMTQVDTLPGEEIEFSIGDPRWVMRSQADLYSNRELAVVREYSTNAFDANKQKALDEGTSIAPIHVTLPSILSPYFKVRDYGYGMTRDILADVYTKFGTSTKRDSNHFNGMLGYGSKSAVAYSTQFTVISIAEGIKTVAVVTRKPDWSIVMKIVSQQHTTEPSGTEIVVPVHNTEEFAHKAMDFYKFWLPGTVLVNGTEPKHHVGQKISDGFYASPDWNQSYVVMGNVPYRIENPSALFRDTEMNAINFVAYVETGDVEFTPSREALKYTDLTKDSLRKVISEFATEIKAKASREITSSTTHAEAYAAWKKWSSVLGSRLFGDLTFNGDRFKSDFTVNAFRFVTSGARGGSYNIHSWSVDQSDRTLFITGYPQGSSVSSSQKAKAREYIALKGYKNIAYVLFVRANDIDNPWLSKDKFIDWEALKAALPKTPRTPGTSVRTARAKGTFDVVTKKGRQNEVEIDDLEGNLYYMTLSEYNRGAFNVPSIISFLPKSDDETTVVLVGANREAKFNRDYPDIKPFINFAKSQIIADGASILSQDAKDVKSIDYAETLMYRVLDESRLDDPTLVRYIGLVKRGVTDETQAEYERNLNLSRVLMRYGAVKEFSPPRREYLSGEYPMMSCVTRHSMPDDVYLYMNAKYAAKAARKDKND